jgi:ABC-2 type transport system ATP-binding protein
MRSDGSTALLSSHIVTDVEEACDRLTILGGGKILLDSPLEVARRSHHMTEGESEPGPAGATEVGSFAGRGRRA